MQIPYIQIPSFESRHEAAQWELGYFKANPKCEQFVRMCSPNEYPPEEYNRFGPDQQMYALVVQVSLGLVESMHLGLPKDLEPNKVGTVIADTQFFVDWVRGTRTKGRIEAFFAADETKDGRTPAAGANDSLECCQPGEKPSPIENQPKIDISYIECPSFNNFEEAVEFDTRFFLANPQSRQFLRLVSPNELEPGECPDMKYSQDVQIFGLIINVIPVQIERCIIAISKKYDPTRIAAWCSQEPDIAEMIKDTRRKAFKKSVREGEKYVKMANRELHLMRR